MMGRESVKEDERDWMKGEERREGKKGSLLKEEDEEVERKT